MKKHLLFLLLAMSMPLFAQTNYQTTTYTTLQDGCGAKNIGVCRVPVMSDLPSDVTAVTFDNRSNGGSFQLNTATSYKLFRGKYTGFNGNPDGSHDPYLGLGTYDGIETLDSTGATPNGTAHGQLQFRAFWAGQCSGKGCGPVVIGWHYVILSGSTVEVQ